MREQQLRLADDRTARVAGREMRVEAVSKKFGQAVAVDDVTLGISAGEFVSLLGPSGSGKSTLLMIIAGFEQPDSGELFLGGERLTDIPPHRRNFGHVFQKYALFPHMTAAENIAFPLKMRGIEKAKRGPMVANALERMRLSALGERLPHQLSGGQQQRVALARAIVFQPALLLMDEPLGALDKKLREEMQIEIKQIQRELGITVVFVTHDQDEALSLSDRVAVINQGGLSQFATPRELYDRPSSRFVADFVGDNNFFPGQLIATAGRKGQVKLDGGKVLAGQLPEGKSIALGAKVEIAVRPEAVSLNSKPDSRVSGTLIDVQFTGGTTTRIVRHASGAIYLSRALSAGSHAAQGDAVSLQWDETSAFIYPADGRA
ncbi:ABC transporter ATP-binding protein [Aestuariivirga sp. YIM B02566]|uniref:ABC transporter ATP-binding protein n=1 Tax=Taklimakanibacter albus TaxID=2800327 RepID=A0ACC5R7U3_9HYPH|nr:ABC transporter ATP-binding protein [Aestuariivirga sp. YIM B02566]MBK1868692.1 ABC transporter ATP-binding protein [Aestuariivirga sp. YIM B02566]